MEVSCKKELQVLDFILNSEGEDRIIKKIEKTFVRVELAQYIGIVENGYGYSLLSKPIVETKISTISACENFVTAVDGKTYSIIVDLPYSWQIGSLHPNEIYVKKVSPIDIEKCTTEEIGDIIRTLLGYTKKKPQEESVKLPKIKQLCNHFVKKSTRKI